MDFREFATNYLNPIFLMYRAALLAASCLILFFSLPMFTRNASGSDMAIIFVISLALSAGFYAAFRRRSYLLYMVIPFAFIVMAISIRGNDVVDEGVLIFPMAMWWTSALLLAFNGIRSWGYGISMKDIGNKVNKLS